MQLSDVVFLSFIGILVGNVIYNSNLVQIAIKRIERRLNKLEEKLKDK